MVQKLGTLIILLGIAVQGFGQDYVNAKQRDLMMKMDEGVALMNQGNYASADSYFQQVLTAIEVVPAELCFYFGKNSYHLKKYKQSIDWLNKYIEIKGTTGQFFDQAREYLALSETDYLAEKVEPTRQPRREAQTKLQRIDCNATPFVLCPVCKGSGVLIEQGALGSAIYRTCPYSDGSGRMTCEDYQKYANGNLVISP
ncbi:hypothetical protein [Tunicatimonas pelagia]|uniref:hypothetical protein n=1 Tax=Tunicatimonas pelagia TaxID=931531 RepID=UPI002666002C|nr:hypothetical protein [Tunicatimonas pelagia]WKN40883.1 hypothetical protein P0M28_17755 [Tunicatimonas pelagia]